MQKDVQGWDWAIPELRGFYKLWGILKLFAISDAIPKPQK